jgi:DNA-binding MarR family transcriptional regulator
MKNLQESRSGRLATSADSRNDRNGHAAQNGHRVNGAVSAAHEGVHGQARELTSLFVSLTRQLLVVNDFVAEMPLRQLRVCMLLYDGPRSMSVLSRELGVSLSAMTQIADRLERARLVKRSFEGNDRRVRCLQLTPSGQKIMQLREEARIQRAQSVVERMSQPAREQVIESMRTLLLATQSVAESSSRPEHGSRNGHC